jgi:ABC-type sugar transport system substrate-binding protein
LTTVWKAPVHVFFGGISHRAESIVQVEAWRAKPANQPAAQHTQGIHDAIEAVKGKVIDQQTANEGHGQAQNLRTIRQSSGAAFAGVIAKNDEMAIGAIQSMKAAASQ